MMIGHIEGATRLMAANQEEYNSLPIRDEIVDFGEGLGQVRVMRSAWFPTPKEIEAMQAGAPVYLCILGMVHPPVQLVVGKIPE